MQDDLRVSADVFSAAGLGTAVGCAVAVAVADGMMDQAEQQGIASSLCKMLDIDAETGAALVMQGLEKAASMPRESLFGEAANELDGTAREVTFVIACAVAARSGNIAVKEGLLLQELSRTLGIGHPSQRYTELLSQGMRLSGR